MCSLSIKDQNHPIPRGVRFVATIKAKNFMNENNGCLRDQLQQMANLQTLIGLLSKTPATVKRFNKTREVAPQFCNLTGEDTEE